MNSRRIYLAALAREVAPLVRSMTPVKASLPKGVRLWASDQAIIGYGGMGAACVSRAFEAAKSLGPVRSIISIGWAGATKPGCELGQVLRPSIVIDARTGERFEALDGDGSSLVTVAKFATLEDKAALNARYAAELVEMEAATLARLAAAHGIPFRAIKSISDTNDFELPGIERFHSQDGSFREGAFGVHIAIRPWLWPAVFRMAHGSKLAVQNHSAAIRRELDEAKN